MSDDLSAYEAFMLQGKGTPATPKIPKGTPATVTPRSKTRLSRTPGSGSGKKTNKSETSVLRAFQGRLEEFRDLDRQLNAVLGSISNLRDRIWWAEERMNELHSQKNWENTCYRPSVAMSLTREDIQLALDHDILQHEKMLNSSRTLITSMAQTLDGAGRRLDEWMMMDIESCLSHQGRLSLEQSMSIYSFFAQELHRKQEMVKQVLDSSAVDSLIYKDSEQGYDSPRVTARKVVSLWISQDMTMNRVIESFLQR